MQKVYENPHANGTWESRFESLVQIGRGEILNPPGNIVDLARIVGKACIGDDLKDLTPETRESILRCSTIQSYTELMVQHLFWQKKIPFTYNPLIRESSDKPDIITPLGSFDVFGIFKDDDDLSISISMVLRADYLFFLKGRRYWIYPVHEVKKWSTKSIGEIPVFYLPLKKADNPEKEKYEEQEVKQEEKSQNKLF